MNWQDDGIILGARSFGENSAIADLMTREHGRHPGLIRGAKSKSMRGLLQPGNIVRADWRARLDEHLGAYKLEFLKAISGPAMANRRQLAALNALIAIAQACLPERVVYTGVYDGMVVLLEQLEDQENWPQLLVRWELGVLAELGFGLDLAKCTATGTLDDLIYVSPRTGRAVSAEAGAPYKDKLMTLPQFLLGSQAGRASKDELAIGFQLTAHFLERHLLEPYNKKLPIARARYVEQILN